MKVVMTQLKKGHQGLPIFDEIIKMKEEASFEKLGKFYEANLSDIPFEYNWFNKLHERVASHTAGACQTILNRLHGMNF
jgi:hypothetical protein